MKRIVLLAIILTCSFLLGSAFAADTITIGALYNVTGGQASLDKPGLQGSQLAAKEINAKGGVLGKQIELVAIDGKTDQTAVTNAMSKFVNVHKVVGVLGLSDSSYALAAGPIAQQAGIPFITSGATLPSLPDEIGDDMFLACYGDNVQAYVEAQFAFQELGAKTAYLLIDTSADFTIALAKFFKEKFVALAGEKAILLEDSYRSGDSDFSGQITKLRALKPQPGILMVAALPDDCGVIVNQLRAAGIETPVISGDGFDTPLLVEVGGEGSRNVYFSTHMSLENQSPLVQNFVKAYKAEYGTDPENAFAALGYDALRLLVAAIEKAGKADPKAIRDALAQTQGFEGVTGKISYEAGKRVPKKSVTIIKVVDQKFKFAKEIIP
jgi:branched-chain amino acid transport system substrate-binding protein